MSRNHPTNYLRKHRKAWGLSQDDLALLLGVSKSTVSRYENDDCVMPVERLLTCEIIFGISSGEILRHMRDTAEDALARATLELHRRLEGKTDRNTEKKWRLLNNILMRANASNI